MVGAQDPMMNFPKDTRFAVYAALGNTTGRKLLIKPVLFLMQGNKPRKIELPAEHLAPNQAKQLSLTSALSNFNGMATLTFSYDGHPGDLTPAQRLHHVMRDVMEVVALMPVAAYTPPTSRPVTTYWTRSPRLTSASRAKPYLPACQTSLRVASSVGATVKGSPPCHWTMIGIAPMRRPCSS